jgi:flagellar biosynthesis protein FlhG
MTDPINFKSQSPMIISVGGGKGGVGKSMVCSNMGVQYAQAGFRVIIIDLDIGAANTHTIFGIRQVPHGLGDFISAPRSRLKDYLLNTDVENLRIVPGSGFVAELASLKHVQKVKLLNQIKTLPADIILLDLGAGSSNHVVDFFSMSNASIVVTTPEPTAIVNAYEFLKNVIYRILFRMFKKQDEILTILKNSTAADNSYGISTISELIEYIKKDHLWAAETILEICNDLDFHVIFNQAKQASDVQLGAKLCKICKRFINLKLNFGGMIFQNERVSSSVVKMTPVSLIYPDCPTSVSIKRQSITIFKRIANKMLDEGNNLPFEEQLEEVTKNAKKDFKLNLLDVKRQIRQREREREEMLVS